MSSRYFGDPVPVGGCSLCPPFQSISVLLAINPPRLHGRGSQLCVPLLVAVEIRNHPNLARLLHLKSSNNLVQLIDKLKLASPTMAENHIQGPNSNEHELACENRIVRVVAPAVYRLWQLQC